MADSGTVTKALPQDVGEAFENQELCYLATSGDGHPNVVPVGFKGVWDGRLLIVDLFFGKTRENVAANPLVAVSVAWTGPKAGFQVKGRASMHRSGPAFDEACRILTRHGVDLPPFAAVVVDVAEIHRLDPGNAERIV